MTLTPYPLHTPDHKYIQRWLTLALASAAQGRYLYSMVTPDGMIPIHGEKLRFTQESIPPGTSVVVSLHKQFVAYIRSEFESLPSEEPC